MMKTFKDCWNKEIIPGCKMRNVLTLQEYSTVEYLDKLCIWDGKNFPIPMEDLNLFQYEMKDNPLDAIQEAVKDLTKYKKIFVYAVDEDGNGIVMGYNLGATDKAIILSKLIDEGRN